MRPAAARGLAAAFFLVAALFVVTGLQFMLAPATLEPWGFRANPGVVRRVFGLCFFGGVGAILIHVGRGLAANKAWSRSYVVSLAAAIAVWATLELAGF